MEGPPADNKTMKGPPAGTEALPASRIELVLSSIQQSHIMRIYKGSAWAPAMLRVGQGGTRTRKRGKSCSCSIRHYYWKFKVMPRV